MANGKIPNINNKFYGEKLVEVTFPDSTSSLGFDEYNAVLNNVNASVTSSIIMDADYALNARIPTNNDRILSGTAQRMEIQDSNYSSVAWTSPRYVGSQTISATYNDYTPSGSSVTFADGTVGTWKGDQVFDEYPGDETFTRGNPLGKVPAIDLYSTHFVLFDKIELNQGFQERDIFHCLYLIDDKGNKVPLTYKNKNLNTFEKLYRQGDNIEVVFLGSNTQNIFDEYPVIRVGRLFNRKLELKNDLFTEDPSNSNQFLFSGNMLNPDTGSLISNVYLKFKGAGSHVYQSTISPSFYSASLNPDGSYKLRYLYNNSLRSASLNDISTQHILQSRFTAPGNQVSQSDSYTYRFSQINGYYVNNKDSRLDPWFVFTYNPTNGKVFEDTIYETDLDFLEFKTAEPSVGGIPLWSWAFSEFNSGYNPPQEIPSISTLKEGYSPLKIGDDIILSHTDTSEVTQFSSINNIPPSQLTTDSINDIILYEDVAELNVVNIKLPGDVLGYYELNESNVFQSVASSSFYGIGGIAYTGYWQLSAITTDTSNTVVPSVNGTFVLGTYDHVNITEFVYLGTTYNAIHPSSVHWIRMHIETTTPTISFDGWLEEVNSGDIIEIAICDTTSNTIIDTWRYMVLNNVPALVPGSYNMCKVQFLSGGSGLIQEAYPNSPNPFTTSTMIRKMNLYSDPYIDVTSTVDLPTIINNPGTSMRISNKIIHEQYIESQYLTGSGVGVILPDDFDPKLRDQLPDIINKTGIDINSLVQGNN